MADEETLGLVIGDSSALVALAACRALPYLEELADGVKVPGKVFEKARKIARFNGIPVIGSLGILLAAKEQALIPSISPFVERLRAEELFFSDTLLQHVLRLAGEE